jgi:hypothetical protein
MVNRIGAQVAVLRRSIDRLWEDQSIETCDDWVIAYIGDLLATNLVSSLDARGQRVDVANTIYYRRRKGTLAILEEIAADITGWNARVIEFFRRMGRTRHGFDPPVAGDSALLQAEGLTGLWTSTPAGGCADLRNSYGASKAHSSFDEFSHAADLRLGVDQVGWHNISHLGVFLWRLASFGVNPNTSPTTPVASALCTGQYSFDPTGRQIPLFAAASRDASSYGDNWVSPQEWQLPGPINMALLQAALQSPATIPLYASTDAQGNVTLNSLAVFTNPGTGYVLIAPSAFLTAQNLTMIYPERGCFVAPTGAAAPFYVMYSYGFSSTIGAGAYDRRLPGVAAIAAPTAQTPISGGTPVPDPSPTGFNFIQDSLTYTSTSDITFIDNVLVQAAPFNRPVLRFPNAASDGNGLWTLTGSGEGSVLVLDGLLVSGADILLAGTFDSVTLSCCTLDPGNAGTGAVFAQSVDARNLAPTRLWIEADVETLTLDRCVMGPVRTRNGGSVQTLAANDSIIQGIRTSDPTQPLTLDDIQDPTDLARALRPQTATPAPIPSPMLAFLRGQLSATTLAALEAWNGLAATVDGTLVNDVLNDLNALIATPFYTPALFAGITLSPATAGLAASNPSGAQLTQLNRLLLEEAYPVALAQAALALGGGGCLVEPSHGLGAHFCASPRGKRMHI